MLSLSQLNVVPSPARTPESGRITHQFASKLPIPTKSAPISAPRCVGRTNEEQLQQPEAVKEAKEEEDKEEEYRVLISMRTMYNQIIIVDTPTKRMLLLDDFRM